MAVTASRAPSRRFQRQRAMLDRLKVAANAMGLTDGEPGEPLDAQRRYDAVLGFDGGRRIYVASSETTETISLYVGDGGSGELRYDPDSRRWQGLFGGVPVLRDAENELREFLGYLMGS